MRLDHHTDDRKRAALLDCLEPRPARVFRWSEGALWWVLLLFAVVLIFSRVSAGCS